MWGKSDVKNLKKFSGLEKFCIRNMDKLSKFISIKKKYAHGNQISLMTKK